MRTMRKWHWFVIYGTNMILTSPLQCLGRNGVLGMTALHSLSFQDEADADPFYHNDKKGSRVEKGKGIDKANRQFIAWDGEGVTPEKGKQQNYVLFGVSTKERIISERLTTQECLAFI